MNYLRSSTKSALTRRGLAKSLPRFRDEKQSARSLVCYANLVINFRRSIGFSPYTELPRDGRICLYFWTVGNIRLSGEELEAVICVEQWTATWIMGWDLFRSLSWALAGRLCKGWGVKSVGSICMVNHFDRSFFTSGSVRKHNGFLVPNRHKPQRHKWILCGSSPKEDFSFLPTHLSRDN